jgi:MFS family permease
MPGAACASMRDPLFVLYWAGQSVSLLGTQFTVLALPMTAALTLHASALDMGVLGAMQFAPALLFGAVIGVWLDRQRRRPAIVLGQMLSMTALATVPVAAYLHLLTLQQLYLVAFTCGVASALFTVAQNAFLPALVGREHLVEANAKFMTTRTIAQMVGPGIAGLAIQVMTAPLVIAFDAVSFLVGALSAAVIRSTEPAAGAGGSRRDVISEAREGLAYLWSEPLVRAIMLTLMAANLGSFVSSAAYVLLFVGRLGVSPAQIGFVYAVGSLSSLAGAQLARSMSRRGGLGATLALSCLLYGAGQLITTAAAFTSRGPVLPLLLVGRVVSGLSIMAFNVNQQAVRQAVIPDRLLGRAQAGLLMVVWGAQVLGSLAGGAIGQQTGLRWALVAGALLCLLSVPAVLLSPVRTLQDTGSLSGARA